MYCKTFVQGNLSSSEHIFLLFWLSVVMKGQKKTLTKFLVFLSGVFQFEGIFSLGSIA